MNIDNWWTKENIARLRRSAKDDIKSGETFSGQDFIAALDMITRTLTRAEAAERELAALREQTRWRKFPDEKPDDNAGVFTMSEDEVYGTRTVLQGDYWQGMFLDLSGDDIENVTHWRPLPEPPEGA